ncbi:beta-soluble NSF attachment protein isoform X3 [Elephas maximus indicus]|uniref:beta-soluble NSF attachment protein isoform X3 n=1 Tax=Elephas maximus indicus TaxID=99487 RepID=UPI00211721D5|nr:beta-soluble NSF attachment protein isoform X3 [Elephas maximus indicus]
MDNAGKEREAVQLMAEAEKRVKASHSFLRGLFGGNTRIEEACEMYTRAANMFKMAKNWSGILVIGNQGTEWLCNLLKVAQQVSGGAKNRTQAGWFQSLQCFLLSDETSENQLREMHFVKQPSSICSFRANMILPLALWMPGMLIKRQTHKGRFSIAAKHHITIAEIYETELVDIEKVGTNTMDNPLLKYSAKDYFFKAALCHFIVDELNAKLALEKYEEMFPAFTDSRECKLLKKLLEAHEEQNSEAYTEAVKEFDSISRLDQWLTTMLLRIKKSIQGDGEGDGDLK